MLNCQVWLPDGRMQSVEYSSSDPGGYQAAVLYRDLHSSFSRSPHYTPHYNNV